MQAVETWNHACTYICLWWKCYSTLMQQFIIIAYIMQVFAQLQNCVHSRIPSFAVSMPPRWMRARLFRMQHIWQLIFPISFSPIDSHTVDYAIGSWHHACSLLCRRKASGHLTSCPKFRNSVSRSSLLAYWVWLAGHNLVCHLARWLQNTFGSLKGIASLDPGHLSSDCAVDVALKGLSGIWWHMWTG